LNAYAHGMKHETVARLGGRPQTVTRAAHPPRVSTGDPGLPPGLAFRPGGAGERLWDAVRSAYVTGRPAPSATPRLDAVRAWLDEARARPTAAPSRTPRLDAVRAWLAQRNPDGSPR